MSDLHKNSSNLFLINVDDYEVVKKINRGGYGKINLVRNKKNGEEYAAKTNLIKTKNQNKAFISREIRILIQIQHPTIIQFKGFSYKDFHNKKNITILMRYMEKGSLADLLSKEEKSLCSISYDNTKRQIILIGIARGMMILHNCHVIHRDLKPENILLDNDYYPYLSDFGLSKFFDPHHSMSQSMIDVGTSLYMAPEVIESNHFNTKADVYAFGILMYEVITGKRAYSEYLQGENKLSVFQLKKKITEGLRPKIKEGTMKKGLKLMIEKCWSQNPRERPTFSEIYRKLCLSRDDYFTEFENGIEPSIVLNDEDDEEEEEEQNEFNEMIGSKKFCLCDVNIDDVLDYVDLINVEPISLINQVDKKSSIDNNEDKKEIKNLRKKISSLESELNESKSEMAKFKDECSILISQMKHQISEQQKELIKIKEESNKKVEFLEEKIKKLINEQNNKNAESKESEKRFKEEITKIKNEQNLLNERERKFEEEINKIKNEQTLLKERNVEQTSKKVESEKKSTSNKKITSNISSDFEYTYEIFVKLSTEKTIIVDVSSSNTVMHVKKLIEDKEGYPIMNQYLVFQTKPLRDEFILGHYGIGPNSMINLIFRPFSKNIINIKQIDGNQIEIDYHQDDKIIDVKKQIEKINGIPASKQSLVFRGKELDDKLTLKENKIYIGYTLHLIKKIDFTEKIFVQKKDGKMTCINVSMNDKVSVLKAKIENIENCPSKKQVLIYSGCRLEDHKTLKQYNIQNNSIIKLEVQQQSEFHRFNPLL